MNGIAVINGKPDIDNGGFQLVTINEPPSPRLFNPSALG
jgi:hypothetical protein